MSLPELTQMSISLNPELYFYTMMNGLVIGVTLVLVTLGLSLIFGLAGIVNFAHGALLMVGVYATWFVTSNTGSLFIGLIAAFLSVGLIGVVFERFFLKKVYGKSLLIQVLLTYGFSIFLEGAIIAIWGSTPKSLSIPEWGNSPITVFSFSLPTYRLYVVFTATIIIYASYVLMTRTNIGLIIRAGIEDREMVEALGIKASNSFLITFVLGAGLAGLAGALIAPIDGVYPTIGVNYLILAFVVVVVGGLGSFRGSVVAGLFIGQLIAFTGIFYASAANLIVFVFMALMLLVKPRGLFGRKGVLD